MRSVLALILSFSSTRLPPAQAGGPAWSGVMPLHTTREDVERLLGQPTNPGKKASAGYDLPEAIR